MCVHVTDPPHPPAAFITMLTMPFTHNIAYGECAGGIITCMEGIHALVAYCVLIRPLRSDALTHTRTHTHTHARHTHTQSAGVIAGWFGYVITYFFSYQLSPEWPLYQSKWPGAELYKRWTSGGKSMVSEHERRRPGDSRALQLTCHRTSSLC